MKKKKLKKYIKKRLHNIIYMAQQGMKDFEIAAELDMTELEMLGALKKMPEDMRLYKIAKNQGYSRDMERLKTWIEDKDINTSLVKVYLAQRHGITDKVEPTDDNTSEDLANLFQELAEKLPK
jgi:hypothetical protein